MSLVTPAVINFTITARAGTNISEYDDKKYPDKTDTLSLTRVLLFSMILQLKSNIMGHQTTAYKFHHDQWVYICRANRTT